MRKSALILAGTAIALAATAVTAAERAHEHIMTVLLPDGSIEHVRYSGDVAPHIVVRPMAAGAPTSLFAPFGPASPFAEMARISAAMNAQASAMMRQVSAMAAARPAASGATPQMTVTASGPAGATYHYVSTTTVNGKTCTTSVQSISQGAGKAPQLLRQVSGDCSTAMQRPTGPVPAVAPAPPTPPAKPRLTSLPVPPAPPAAPKSPTVPADSI
jgi:hypothetical protein